MLDLQTLWSLGNARRQAFAFSANNPGPLAWKNCDGTTCPLGGYYYGAPPNLVFGSQDSNPRIDHINKLILAGEVVINPDGSLTDVASGQAVGLINGAIVLPGDSAPVNAPLPKDFTPGAPGGFLGITPVPSTAGPSAPSGTGGFSDAVVAQIGRIEAMLSRIIAADRIP